MSTKNSKLPRDVGSSLIQLVPDRAALARTYNASLTGTAVTITLNANTSFLEIYCKSIDVVLKYGTTAVTTSNFDEFIGDGQTRNYVVPEGVTSLSVAAVTGVGSLVIIEK
jgi:hypothetical protein